MDELVCGRLDNHSPVACRHHLHAPEDRPAHRQDHPQVRSVPGEAADKRLFTQSKVASNAVLLIKYSNKSNLLVIQGFTSVLFVSYMWWCCFFFL